jgi:membrane protein implicated in regulation of membrane protease activity
MRRKVFDKLASVGGVAVVIVLAVAGALLMFGYSFANNYVHTQLAEQQITFPSAAAFAHPDGQEITKSMTPTVSQYAGQQLVTGAQAQVYANDFIAVHLQGIGGGKTYSQLSAEALALPKGSAAYTAAEAKAQTVFQGTTLRGLLLEAYGFSLIAMIALWCAIAAFALAGVMAVLVGLGFAHARKTDDKEELMPSHAPRGVLVNA